MKRKGQVVLETALVIVAMAILVIGVMRIWAWFINQYSGRWQSYNQTRLQAGQRSTYEPASQFIPDGYTKEKLNLFK